MGQPSVAPGPAQRLPVRVLVLAGIRILGTVTLLILLYFVLPLQGHLSSADLSALLAGIGIFVVVVVLQVASILQAEYPGVRAVESLSALVPLFLVIFASYYYILGRSTPGSFNTSLTKLDALYFTVTVFATVGFGDIVAVSQTARTAVLLQMIGNLLVLGVLLKVVLGAREKGLARKRAESDGPSEDQARDRE
ncbi:MAG: potassium channel family protein [Motilibacteraceae bacterium]